MTQWTIGLVEQLYDLIAEGSISDLEDFLPEKVSKVSLVFVRVATNPSMRLKELLKAIVYQLLIGSLIVEWILTLLLGIHQAAIKKPIRK